MHLPCRLPVCTLNSLILASGIHAQGGAASSAASSHTTSNAIGRDTSPLNPENALEIIRPPSAAEERAFKAFKSFQSISNEDLGTKTQGGEDFVKKYPTTTYTPHVYSFLTAYVQLGAVDKGLAAGERDLQPNPQDYRTMAVLSQSISRMVTASSPDAPSRLAKAESYGNKAIEGVAPLAKPDGMSDAAFAVLKNQILSMAHGGIGLAFLHRKDFAGSIPELEQAISFGTNDDATNFYLLGVASQNSRHYDKAEVAFEKMCCHAR